MPAVTAATHRLTWNEKPFIERCTEKLTQAVNKIREIFMTILRTLCPCFFPRNEPQSLQQVVQISQPTSLRVQAQQPPAPQPPALQAQPQEPPAPQPPALQVQPQEPQAPEPAALEAQAPEQAQAAAPPRITKFLRNGKLHDFTARKIAGLIVNDETHYRDGNPYQFLTLNSYKVLQYGKPGADRNGNFDLSNEEDKLLVRDAPDQPGKIEVSVYNSTFDRIEGIVLVDPTKVYVRAYIDSDGRLRREHVLVTNRTILTEPFLGSSTAKYLTPLSPSENG